MSNQFDPENVGRHSAIDSLVVMNLRGQKVLVLDESMFSHI